MSDSNTADWTPTPHRRVEVNGESIPSRNTNEFAVPKTEVPETEPSLGRLSTSPARTDLFAGATVVRVKTSVSIKPHAPRPKGVLPQQPCSSSGVFRHGGRGRTQNGGAAGNVDRWPATGLAADQRKPNHSAAASSATGASSVALASSEAASSAAGATRLAFSINQANTFSSRTRISRMGMACSRSR